MKKKTIIQLLIIVILILMSIIIFYDKFTSRVTVVEIGSVTPLSGVNVKLGQQITDILDHYLPYINEMIAQSGYSFVLIHKDGGCDETMARTAYHELKDSGVRYIVGGACSAETLAIAEYSADDHVLTISPSSSKSTIEGLSPYTFTLSYRIDSIVLALAHEMSKYERVAVVTADRPYNTSIHTSFTEAMAQYPTDIVADETFSKNSTDHSALLRKVQNANPDAIFLNPHSRNAAIGLVDALSKMSDWTGYILYGQGSVYRFDDVLASTPDVTEGMLVIDLPSIVHPDFDTMYDTIESEYDFQISLRPYHVAATLDALDRITALIIQEEDNVELVRNALVSTSYEGYIGTIDFTSTNFTKSSGAGKYIVENGMARFKENLYP